MTGKLAHSFLSPLHTISKVALLTLAKTFYTIRTVSQTSGFHGSSIFQKTKFYLEGWDVVSSTELNNLI
jgi:hypothetical protein